MRRPAFWIALSLLSAGAVFVGVRYFPQAFSIVALDITMDREQALAEARAIMARDGLGPADYRQAASFARRRRGADVRRAGRRRQGRLHADAARRPLLRLHLARPPVQGRRDQRDDDPLHAGRPPVRLRRAAEGRRAGRRHSTPAAARTIAEDGSDGALERGLSKLFTARRAGPGTPSSADASTTPSPTSVATPTLNEGRYRLRLVVSGDRLTEVTHFIKIPEAFSRRYARMRSANEAIGIGSVVGAGAPLRRRRHRHRPVRHAAARLGALAPRRRSGASRSAACRRWPSLNEFPLLWMTYDTALPRATFLAQQIAAAGRERSSACLGVLRAVVHGRRDADAPRVRRIIRSSGASGAKGPGSVDGRSSDARSAAICSSSVFFAYDVVLYL